MGKVDEKQSANALKISEGQLPNDIDRTERETGKIALQRE